MTARREYEEGTAQDSGGGLLTARPTGPDPDPEEETHRHRDDREGGGGDAGRGGDDAGHDRSRGLLRGVHETQPTPYEIPCGNESAAQRGAPEQQSDDHVAPTQLASGRFRAQSRGVWDGAMLR